ncbi:hypothetical protein BDQ12DRAFT_743907 [Crucibulum laeve]|uniref:DUF6533 domain-containing protein n=1 Tax=Crucibulum laeve TaxID=68775 RepID=A0A5C3MEI2_9AGAR|nr:hypothetical protein BDQ12DRAFT_743907 [Crucibulum laeve]
MDDIGHDDTVTALDILLHDYLQLPAITILFYDHLITLGDEITYVWRRPKGSSAYWFFFNRYLAFLGNVLVTYPGFSSLSVKSCGTYNLFRELLFIVNQVLVGVLLTLRIYALYGRSYRILRYMVGIAVILIIISCWSLFGRKSPPSEQGTNCHVGLSKELANNIAVAWEALLIYDSIIFGLTVFKTWQTRREYTISGIRIPLASLILRDGAIYFAVMALANLANIVTFYLCGPFLRGGLSTFASSISLTMMSRLMLNLHEGAAIGIFSAQLSAGIEFSGTSRYDTTNIIELDTFWSDEVDRQSSFPPSISRIGEGSRSIELMNITRLE